MKTVGNYDDYELSDMKRVRVQGNMLVATVHAKKHDSITGDLDHRVILIVVNNNTQFETMIPISAWQDIVGQTHNHEMEVQV